MKAVYRIVCILIGIGIFSAAFFVNFFGIEIYTNPDSDTITSIIEAVGSDYESVGVKEEFSVKRIISIIKGDDYLSDYIDFENGKGFFLWPEEFHVLNTRIVVFAVSFALLLVGALFMIIMNCCTYKRMPMLILGVVGIALSIVMTKSFTSISADITSGKVNVIGYILDQIMSSSELLELIGSLFGSTVDSLLNNAVKIGLYLSGLQNALLFLYIGLTAWTVIYYLVDIGDPEVKKEKEELKAEKLAKKNSKKVKKA